jgi:hypothetical protein
MGQVLHVGSGGLMPAVVKAPQLRVLGLQGGSDSTWMEQVVCVVSRWINANSGDGAPT